MSYEHQARKRFGQNFLVDANIISRIVRAVSPRSGDHLVEIGPGQGAITGELLRACPNLHVVELDRDLIPVLRDKFASSPDFTIHEADALKFDFAQLVPAGAQLRVVGNLPYNISTPLLFHLLGYRELVRDMHFMLQKEVVERMAAEPGGKEYGRLSIMCQYYCSVEFLFEVGPGCFRPAPKVDSAIVRLTPHAALPHPAADPKLLDNLVKTAFQQRRKTLRNALKQWLPDAELWAQVNIDPQQRPENLSVRDYVTLANHLQSLRSSGATSL
ncbi:MAG: 16S rRNA (adenine(1518)-N(6)/adenine(1519)-N(6))-dimethyltransferase RsmA [Cellvibrionaceae bacterium]|nr:16S rRNA (adenine(1518)-N(6)/adenine(1519)-N(6))-dimethyltransferase RsmA [Cellvibrionaceae bacterium]